MFLFYSKLPQALQPPRVQLRRDLHSRRPGAGLNLIRGQPRLARSAARKLGRGKPVVVCVWGDMYRLGGRYSR
jgi:hypothetical protein